MERWMMRDPFEVVSRMEEQAQRKHAKSKEAKAHKAKQQLHELFGEDMGRRLEVAPHITAALHQWGEWANRKQFWENLSVTPFCKLLGIGHGREMPDIRLDPQSMAIHKAVMRQPRETQTVLVGYYVGGFNWDEKTHVFKDAGISRKKFYELLKMGSISVFNAAKRHVDL